MIMEEAVNAREGAPRVALDPDSRMLEAISRTNPENPFHTPAFARALARRGGRTVAFLAGDAGTTVGCTGLLTRGRVECDLRITSAPAAPANHPIWAAITTMARGQGGTRLRLQSFGSPATHLPALPGERDREQRREYVLTLAADAPPPALSTNHRRNVRRAQRSGISVAETVEPDAADLHAALIDQSMARRRERGEAVGGPTAADGFRDLLAAGAASLFQAQAADTTVLASLLILAAPRGAYYHSAGTSPAGMQAGAAHLLVTTAAERLAGRGVNRFNLGGAAFDAAGLARFKSGFGATVVTLEAATFDLADGPRRTLVWLARGLRAGCARVRGPLAVRS